MKHLTDEDVQLIESLVAARRKYHQREAEERQARMVAGRPAVFVAKDISAPEAMRRVYERGLPAYLVREMRATK